MERPDPDHPDDVREGVGRDDESRPDFARGEREEPREDVKPDFARGEREKPEAEEEDAP